jgi:hypothetical protein
VAEALLLGLALGLLLAEALLLGVAEALSVALGVAVALLLALGVLLAFAVAEALAVALAVADWVALAEGDGELLDLAVDDVVALGLGVWPEERETASRTIAVWLAGTERSAEVLAGGWPHTLVAAALTVAASAAVPPRRPPMIPEETMATPATMPNAEDPDRAEIMAAPSSPWSSSSRPRVSSDSSDRPCAETIPCCRSSTPAPRRTVREHRGLPASSPEYSVGQVPILAMSRLVRTSAGRADGLPPGRSPARYVPV